MSEPVAAGAEVAAVESLRAFSEPTPSYASAPAAASAPVATPGPVIERALSELRPGQGGVLERLELAEVVAERLMELGFVPGTELRVAHAAPGGDPCVYRVDGAEIALRNATARCLIVRGCEAADGAR